MTALVKHNGLWKEPRVIYIKDGGLWKEVGGMGLPAPGKEIEGGFLAGYIYQGDDVYGYIMADRADQVSLPLRSGTGTIVATSNSDGRANTLAMIASSENFPAAQYCYDYRGGGFDDWFLPARNQMRELMQLIPPNGPVSPPGFGAGQPQANQHQANFIPYWSSTERTTSVAYAFDFSSSTELNNRGNTTNGYVRPVRLVRFI